MHGLIIMECVCAPMQTVHTFVCEYERVGTKVRRCICAHVHAYICVQVHMSVGEFKFMCGYMGMYAAVVYVRL